MSDSLHEVFAVKLACGWATGAAADTAEIDLRYYFVSPGKRELMACLTAYSASDSGTLALKLQESPTTVDSDYTDITSGGFTTLAADADQTQDSAATEQIWFSLITGSRFIRSYHTVTGSTTGWRGATELFMIKRNA